MSDSLDPHKRNLLAISIAHIVLYLSGGELDGASMLGGTVKNANGDVLLAAAWLLYFYFFWMYWRSSKGSRSGLSFKNDLTTELRGVMKSETNKLFDLNGKEYRAVTMDNCILYRKRLSFYLAPDLRSGYDTTNLPSLGYGWRYWRVYLKALSKVIVDRDWVPYLLIPFTVAGAAFVCFLLSIFSALTGN
jgi:hypothetical protein